MTQAFAVASIDGDADERDHAGRPPAATLCVRADPRNPISSRDAGSCPKFSAVNAGIDEVRAFDFDSDSPGRNAIAGVNRARSRRRRSATMPQDFTRRPVRPPPRRAQRRTRPARGAIASTRSAISAIGTAQTTKVARQLSPTSGNSNGKSPIGKISPHTSPLV